MQEKILIIGPVFYNYHKNILSVFNKKGFQTTYLSEIKYGLVDKILKHFNSSLRKLYNNYFLFKNVSNLNEEYNYIILIRGEVISSKTIKTFFAKQQKARKILYLWDSVRENKNVLNLLKYFDSVKSFDMADCEKYGFLYLPLFYTPYESGNEKIIEKDIDILFVGLDFGDRYTIIKKVREYCYGNSLNFKCFLLTTRFKHLKRILSLKKFNKSDFIFEPLRQEVVKEYLDRSHCVLDIHNSLQAGLTMRTIEILSQGNKLITTNNNIVNTNLYKKENILIIDRKEPVLNNNFIKSSAKKIDLSKFTIDSWILNLIGSDE